MTAASIAIIVISYRNNRELTGFLRHLHESFTSGPDHVVAVANGLAPAEVTELERMAVGLLPGRLRLVAGPANPGYFGGAEKGHALLRQAPTPPDWVIVTNDDIRFAPDFFASLRAQDPARSSVLAPDLVVPATGLHQNPYYTTKPSRRRLQQLLWLHRRPEFMKAFVALRALRQRWRRQRPAPPPTARTEIYAPHGACMVFSGEYFSRGQTLRYPSFLYGEEFFVAESARRTGLPIAFEPSLRAEHHEHSSTGLLAPVSMARYVHESLTFVLREYYSAQ